MEEQKKGKVQLTDGRVFNFEDHNLYSGDHTILKANLQGYEYDVFYCLADHYPTPQSVDQLIALIWEKRTPPITPDPSRVRQVIGNLRAFLDDKKPFKIIVWVNKSIYSDGGYKCCSQLIVSNVDPDEQPDKKTKKSKVTASYLNGGSQAKPDSCFAIDNVIKLSSVLIHKGGQDHPKIDAELELEIRYIIGLLEQGLSEDFEEVCEQAWEELTLMQKAMKIFRAYENLTDRSRNLSPIDPNTRL